MKIVDLCKAVFNDGYYTAWNSMSEDERYEWAEILGIILHTAGHFPDFWYDILPSAVRQDIASLRDAVEAYESGGSATTVLHFARRLLTHVPGDTPAQESSVSA